VASTRNGRGRSRVTPSTDTRRSAMASRRADCVFGVARLISSDSRTLVKIGPGRNSKVLCFWSRIDDPVMSPGNMSGVHCTRFEVALIDWAMARASIDLPVPGTSSKRMWPSQRMATRASRTTSVLPLITDSMFSTIASKAAEKAMASMVSDAVCSARAFPFDVACSRLSIVMARASS
jgi:hypothetical protein